MKRSHHKKRKRRKNKRRKDKRRNRRDALTVSRRPGTVRLDITPLPLEILREHDGLLRGSAEPVIMVAAYVRDENPAQKGVRFVSRRLFRYSVKRKAPCWADARKSHKARTARFHQDATLIVLVIACEEDSGRDIEQLFTELNAVDDIVLWPLDGSGSVPELLEEVPSMTPVEQPLRVGFRGRKGVAIDRFGSDDYVGSSVIWLKPNQWRQEELVMPIEAADEMNNWTAHIQLRLR